MAAGGAAYDAGTGADLGSSIWLLCREGEQQVCLRTRAVQSAPPDVNEPDDEGMTLVRERLTPRYRDKTMSWRPFGVPMAYD